VANPSPRIKPNLGEHSEEVLSSLLGMSSADIEQLRQANVLY